MSAIHSTLSDHELTFHDTHMQLHLLLIVVLYTGADPGGGLWGLETPPLQVGSYSKTSASNNYYYRR